jgi:hypothetical protein
MLSGLQEEVKDLLSLPGIEYRFIVRLAYSIDSVRLSCLEIAANIQNRMIYKASKIERVWILKQVVRVLSTRVQLHVQYNDFCRKCTSKKSLQFSMYKK